jgi:hypothetical protein
MYWGVILPFAKGAVNKVRDGTGKLNKHLKNREIRPPGVG